VFGGLYRGGKDPRTQQPKRETNGGGSGENGWRDTESHEGKARSRKKDCLGGELMSGLTTPRSLNINWKADGPPAVSTHGGGSKNRKKRTNANGNGRCFTRMVTGNSLYDRKRKGKQDLS